MAKVIYVPKGKALEYIPDGYALNIYSGCSHACNYCYAPQMLYKDREVFNTQIKLRDNIVEKVRKELDEHRGHKIFLSFTSDPYQPMEHEVRATRAILEMFLEYDIIPIILTKGEIPKEDWELFAKFKELHFGITLTHCTSSKINEEGALSSFLRIIQLEKAKSLGLKTWVSLEPVLNPDQTYEIIRATFPFTDLYKVGKWNYDKRANEIDWTEFVRNIKHIFRILDCNYILKDSLKPYE